MKKKLAAVAAAATFATLAVTGVATASQAGTTPKPAPAAKMDVRTLPGSVI